MIKKEFSCGVKKILIIMLLIVLVVPILSQGKTKKPRKQVTFFSPGSFYVFLLGSFVRINPDHYIYDPKKSAIAPVFGFGWRALNFGSNFFMNLEFDYSQSKLESGVYYGNRRVRFYNFKLGVEYWLKNPRKFAIIGNMGFGSITYPDISDTNYDGNNEPTLFLELGIKAALSKNLSFRTDFRFFLEPNEGGDDYYYDEYYDDNSHLIAFAMSAGIQFNF
jgi:hypothetical protein